MSDYWENPPHKYNQPINYLRGKNKHIASNHLVEIVSTFVGHDSSILEVGCNAGRNLCHLQSAGFKHLCGVEVNERAIRCMRLAYPNLSGAVFHGNIAEVVPMLASKDLIFSMAVLMHIENPADFVAIADKARFLITIEAEGIRGSRIWNHDYRAIFEARGMSQVAYYDFIRGMHKPYVGRVFFRDAEL